MQQPRQSAAVLLTARQANTTAFLLGSWWKLALTAFAGPVKVSARRPDLTERATGKVFEIVHTRQALAFGGGPPHHR